MISLWLSKAPVVEEANIDGGKKKGTAPFVTVYQTEPLFSHMSRIYAIKYHTGTGVVLSLLYFDYVMLVNLI